MEEGRYRFGSGSRHGGDPRQAAQTRSSTTAKSSPVSSVTDRLFKLREEQGRHRRNLVQRGIQRGKVESGDGDFETVLQPAAYQQRCVCLCDNGVRTLHKRRDLSLASLQIVLHH